MVAINFIGGGNLSTQRKPPTCQNHWQEEFEDTKGVIRIRKSKDRQHNGKIKQSSTKYTHNTNDRVTRTPLKTGIEVVCSGRVSSSCFTSDTRHVNLVTKPVISHEWGKDRKVLTTSGTYPWSSVTQIFHNSHPSHGGDRKTLELMTST